MSLQVPKTSTEEANMLVIDSKTSQLREESGKGGEQVQSKTIRAIVLFKEFAREKQLSFSVDEEYDDLMAQMRSNFGVRPNYPAHLVWIRGGENNVEIAKDSSYRGLLKMIYDLQACETPKILFGVGSVTSDADLERSLNSGNMISELSKRVYVS